jgi:hypothetical protein
VPEQRQLLSAQQQNSPTIGSMNILEYLAFQRFFSKDVTGVKGVKDFRPLDRGVPVRFIDNKFRDDAANDDFVLCGMFHDDPIAQLSIEESPYEEGLSEEGFRFVRRI